MMDKTFITLMNKFAEPDHVKQWIQLTPAGEFSGVDGRGPYICDEAAILNAAAHCRLPIDINHAIDLKGTQGFEAPAVGWIVELQARADGIWGRVDWTQKGKELLADKAYGFISPVLMTTGAKPQKVMAIARASLCNDPNLSQLKSLHTSKGRTAMNKELRAALGLPETADDQTVLDTVKAAQTALGAHSELMTSLRKTVGGDENADAGELVRALQARVREKSDEATSLEKSVSKLQNELMAVKNTQARDKAEAFVNKALEEGRLVPALKDHFIARHMKEAEMVEKEIGLMPSLMSGGLAGHTPQKDASGLNPEELKVCELMGVDKEAFAKSKNKELL